MKKYFILISENVKIIFSLERCYKLSECHAINVIHIYKILVTLCISK